MLKTLLLSNLLMAAGLYGIALGLVGVGNWTIVACVVVVVLSTTLYGIAAVRRRPRVVLTDEGFVFEKLFGQETRRWDEVAGPFVVIKVGWNELVAYHFTAEFKARTGRKPTSLFAGYDAVVGGPTLACSAGELAALLNQTWQRRTTADPGAPASLG